MGVPHQNVVKDKLIKNRMSIISKILVQISAKLNYSPWKVEKPLSFKKKKVMLVGIDRYHKLIENRQSCVGYVSTVNSSFTEFYSRASIQKPGEETLTDLTAIVQDSVNEYYTYNNYVPEIVIVYRDGLGEGQMEAIGNLEVEAIKQGFSNIDNSYKP